MQIKRKTWIENITGAKPEHQIYLDESGSIGYVLYDKDGVFHQYREYNSNHEVVLEIGYHHEKSLGHGDILHVHVHNTPGIEHHGQADKFVIKPGHPLYEKYKKLFKGVKQ